MNVPRNIITVFGVRMLLYGNDLPYFGPLCLILLFGCFTLPQALGRQVFTLGREDLWFILALAVWSFLEIHRSGVNANGYLIFSNMWFFVIYYLLKTYIRLIGASVLNKIARVTIYTSVAVLIYYLALQFIVWADIFGSQYIIASEVRYVNGMSFIALFAIHLILFYTGDKTRRERFLFFAMVFPICLLVIGINRSRGVTLGLIGLIFLKVISEGSSRSKRAVACLIFLILAVLVYFRLNSLLGLSHEESVMEHINGVLTVVSSIDDLDPMVVYNLPSDLVSTFSRVKTAIMAFRAFIESPLLGVGFGEVLNIRFAGYISHTYFLLPLAAYGICGAVFYVSFVCFVMRRGVLVMPKETVASVFFLMVAMAFDNEMWPWYAILFVLIRYAAYLGNSRSTCVRSLAPLPLIPGKMQRV